MICNVLAATGIIVPCDSSIFLAVLTIHIPSGIVCVLAGLVALLSKKQPGRHPSFGTIYYWSLSVVFVSASILATLRWTEDYQFHSLNSKQVRHGHHLITQQHGFPVITCIRHMLYSNCTRFPSRDNPKSLFSGGISECRRDLPKVQNT